jgi:chromosome partitioning protein
MDAKVIGIINHKGGCGKTTTAVNLCGMIAEWPLSASPQKVLLIDMDPQGSALRCVSFDQHASEEGVLADLLLATPPGRLPLAVHIQRSPWPGHIDYVPSKEEAMVEAQVVMTQRHINPVAVLRRLIKPVLNLYDYVIIDTGPTQGILMWNVLYAIDYAIIPTMLDAISLQELPKVLRNIDRLEIEFDQRPQLLGILPVSYRKGVTIQEEVLNHLHQKFRGLLFEPIPLNTDIPEAYNAFLSIHRYNASAPATKAYAAVTKEVLKRAQKE